MADIILCGIYRSRSIIMKIQKISGTIKKNTKSAFVIYCYTRVTPLQQYIDTYIL